MAGHSQFKNIMHRKGRQDKARSKLFSKLGREITTAAKMGMADPAFNPRLRMAIIAATPGASGVLYDLPQVVEGAPELLHKHGVADRVRAEGGSFLDGVPEGGDA